MKYNHGGEKYDKHIELDFSANVNPFGMPPEVVDVLSDRKNINGFADYPDANCTAIRQAIAENKGISAENVLCGNGASDIIYRLCFAVKPKKAVLAAPCFSEYEKAVRASGGKISFYDTSEENNFCIQSDFVSFVEKEKRI
jgi:threonine-phosphate decarboxylase